MTRLARDRYQLLASGVPCHVYSCVRPKGHTLKGQKPNEDEIQIRLGFDALIGLERPIRLDPWWGPQQLTKGAPKVGPTRAHLGAPTMAIKGGEGAPDTEALAAPSVGAPLSLLLLLSCIRL